MLIRALGKIGLRFAHLPSFGSPLEQQMDQAPAMSNFSLARRNMVDSQLRTNKVTNHRLIAAMAALPRELFVPSARQAVAYVDEAVSLGHGRWLPAPLMAARLYQLANPGPNDLVMVVGAGTGYGAAVLGRMVSAVVALESIADLASKAETVLATVEADNVVVAQGKLRDGWPKQAPFDVIVIEGAVGDVPDALVAQLAVGGRLVTALVGEAGVPVASVLEKTGSGVAARPVFDATIPAIADFERAREFVF
jgi:protein-L-isoaspartate(D-aspartate) O-methyltransferase